MNSFSKNFNAVLTYPNMKSELRFYTNNLKTTTVYKCEKHIKFRFNQLVKCILAKYNNYHSVVLHRTKYEPNTTCICYSEQYNSTYGSFVSMTTRTAILTHAIDRYEQRSNKSYIVNDDVLILSTDFTLDRILKGIYSFLKINEIYYHKGDYNNQLYVKIGDNDGIFVINKVNDMYLIKTFLTNDMCIYTNWNELSRCTNFDIWLDKAFKYMN